MVRVRAKTNRNESQNFTKVVSSLTTITPDDGCFLLTVHTPWPSQDSTKLLWSKEAGSIKLFSSTHSGVTKTVDCGGQQNASILLTLPFLSS